MKTPKLQGVLPSKFWKMELTREGYGRTLVELGLLLRHPRRQDVVNGGVGVEGAVFLAELFGRLRAVHQDVILSTSLRAHSALVCSTERRRRPVHRDHWRAPAGGSFHGPLTRRVAREMLACRLKLRSTYRLPMA